MSVGVVPADSDAKAVARDSSRRRARRHAVTTVDMNWVVLSVTYPSTRCSRQAIARYIGGPIGRPTGQRDSRATH